eukprot:6700826-Prymnesium_polylepis.1
MASTAISHIASSLSSSAVMRIPLASARSVENMDAARASRTPSRRKKVPTSAGACSVSAAAADSSIIGTSDAAR